MTAKRAPCFEFLSGADPPGNQTPARPDAGSLRASRASSPDQCNFDELDRPVRTLSAGDAPVWSCYEAGRDGFWIYRVLLHRGVDNIVVDPASIEVNRRKRRVKTDRLDAEKPVSQLIRHHRGERVWSMVRVPGVAAEDDRHLHRDLQALNPDYSSSPPLQRRICSLAGAPARNLHQALGCNAASATFRFEVS